MNDSAPAPTPPPGWYPDPSGQPGLRWWDGTGWIGPSVECAAEHHQPPPPHPGVGSGGDPRTTTSQPAPWGPGYHDSGKRPPQGSIPPPGSAPPPPGTAQPQSYPNWAPPSGPPSEQDGTRPWWKKKRVLIPAGFLGLLIAIGALASDPSETQDGSTASSDASDAESTSSVSQSATTQPTTTVAPSTTTTTKATTTEATLPVIDAGTYVVGSEVPAGTYRVVQYWATLDENQEILDNDLVGGDGMSLAVIPESATFVEFSGEAIAVEDFPELDPLVMGFTEGTYLVGADIEPGQYRVGNPSGSAYGARLDSSLDIVDNALNEGSVILTIQPTDYAFSFTGQLATIFRPAWSGWREKTL